MVSDKELRENTKAINNLAAHMVTLGKICKALDENLAAMGRLMQETMGPKELQGECTVYQCSARRKHNHGISCGPKCPCSKALMDRSTIKAVADQCRDPFCENEEMHSHGVGCGKSCSEPTCIRKTACADDILCAACGNGACSPGNILVKQDFCACCKRLHRSS